MTALSIQSLFKVPENLKGEDAREYSFFKLGYPVGILIHASWAFIFFFNNVPSMAIYNLVVSILFFIGAWFWHKNRFTVTFIILLWLIEIPFHALLGTLNAGVQSLFWVAPLISSIVALTTPKFSWPTRITIAILTVLASLTLGLLTFVVDPLHPLSAGTNIYLFATNFIGILGALSLFVGINQYIAQAAEQKLTVEFERAEGLLRNILPDPIALRLKDGERLIANDHEEVSVIFADIVGFTAASAKLSPTQLVETLNLVFSEFDMLAENHGAEKIKTIGDSYMVVVGVPDAQTNHAEKAIALALDMQKAVDSLKDQTHFEVRLRIGINSGSVVAGVIGKRKFAYDIWGDAVNLASRMEAHGKPDQILITQTTANLLSDRFSVCPEGQREIKGKGAVPVYSIGETKQAD